MTAAGYLFSLAIYSYEVIRRFLLKKYSIRSALNVEYETVEHVHTPCYETVNGWAPFYYFNRCSPFFIFQRVGPFFIIFTGVPLLYYFNR